MTDAPRKPKLSPHLYWTIGVLVAIIVGLVVIRWSIYPNFVDRVNFSASLASLILAVLAIVYAFISNQSFNDAVARLEGASRAATDNNARLEASLELVKKMSGRIETFDDKLSRIASTPPPGAKADPLPEPGSSPMIDAVKLVNGIIGAGSWNGLKVIKACQLANLQKRTFNLREMCALDQRVSFDYAYGYLIAMTAVGLFRQENDMTSGNVTVTFFLDIVRLAVDSEILVRTSAPGPDTEVKKAEIAAIEKFIAASPAAPASGT
jgi:hypothetical protein